MKIKIENTMKASLVCTAILSALSTAPLYAADEEEAVERIQVTGSRILRAGAIAPSPVTIISGADLLNTGAINIGEALNDLPALANTFSLANAGEDIGSAGLNILDLRGMGTDRTLVLVDGKRHVSASPGSASVDVNTIPTAWIDRVEIITGGASAVYGADAVTGVVNFVLKKNINGLDVSLTKGIAEESSYNNDKFTLSYGSDFSGGKGNVAVMVSHFQQDGINAKERKQTARPTAEVRNPDNGDTRDENGETIHDGIPDQIWIQDAAWYDDSTGGNFYTYDDDGAHWFIFDPDGSVRPQKLGTTYNWGRCSGDCDILDLTRYNELQPTFSTFNFAVKANYDVTENMNIYADAKFVRVKADSIGQPSFFEYDSDHVIKRDNAYIDSSLAKIMDDADISEFNLHRFNEDIGRRLENNTRETTRLVLGIDGYFTDSWGYSAYVLYGKTERKQINVDNVITQRYFDSIDAVVLDDGTIGCRDESARAEGCIPTTVFGAGNVDSLAAAWFTTDSLSTSKIQQTVANFTVTNSELFELPAGDVGFAAGIEYRKEQSDDMPDAFAATGATFLTALQEEHGEFDVSEVFFESSIPVLSDMPGVQNLTLDIAARYADYSTVGGALSWKVGADWEIMDELRFRTTLAEAIRAPNIGELFSAKGQSFGFVDDPCDVDFNQGATRQANCAALGIPIDAAINPVSSIELLTGGNKELKEEESTSFTAGVVYQPNFIDGLVFTVDYWKIEIDDAIERVSAQDILDKCVDSEAGVNNQFCALVTRDADHKISLVESTTQNVAKSEGEGVDIEVGYDFSALGGDFTTQLIATRLLARKEFPFQIDPTDVTENAGIVGEAKWQGNILLGYKNGAWSANWRTRYLQEVSRFTSKSLAANPDPSNILTYGTYFQTDVRAGYTFDNNLTLEFGVDNLFDRNLPNYTSGTGAGTASYDNVGRFYYTSVSYNF
ncbi:MAG: TonB-dependent receptor [Colwellia sp.]|nr:TonB-dependent receptor [Colwellia sp.]